MLGGWMLGAWMLGAWMLGGWMLGAWMLCITGLLWGVDMGTILSGER
jgi:hypothetical protein